MIKRLENGFSLVELLVVVVIIGVVAALAIPAFQKGIRSAENGTTFGTMRAVASTEIGFFSQNNRFARLTELNPLMGNGIGTLAGERIIRGRYTFEMNPVSPTDAELSREYTITATRNTTDDVMYKYEVTQSGQIIQLFP